jgi:hypothetical protein
VATTAVARAQPRGTAPGGSASRHPCRKAAPQKPPQSRIIPIQAIIDCSVDVLRLKCGCEAGKYGRRCRHLVLAIQYDDWRKRQRAATEAQQRTVEVGMAALQAAFV